MESVIESNLGYFNSKEGWLEDKARADKFDVVTDNDYLKLVKWFYLDVTYIKYVTA
jgi:hypothetical protein